MDILQILREKKPRTIGVDGNSGAGKTTLAKGIATALNAQIIPVDFFHKHERKNWHLLPDMNDFEDLEKLNGVINRLLAGESFTMDGLYEYVSGAHNKSFHFEAKPVLVIEGLCVSRLPLDYKIFVDVDTTVAHDRAKQRDLVERGLTEEQWAVKQRLFHGEYHKITPELKAKSDLIISSVEDVPFLKKHTETSYSSPLAA